MWKVSDVAMIFRPPDVVVGGVLGFSAFFIFYLFFVS